MLMQVGIIGAALAVAVIMIGRKLMKRPLTLDVGEVSSNWVARQRGQGEAQYPY